MTQIVGIDGGSPDVRAAEHLLAEIVTALGPDTVLFGCTHLTSTGGPHVTLSIDLDSAAAAGRLPPGLQTAQPDSGHGAALEAAQAHHHHTSGRVARFPGQHHLVGVLSVAELLATSAIEAIVVLAGHPPDPATRIDTRGFVRPQWHGGRLTLHTVQAPNGMLAPFEVENPTPCCADHAS